MIKINFNGHLPLNEINLLHEYEERGHGVRFFGEPEKNRDKARKRVLATT